MKSMLTNQKGNLAIALVLAVVGIMSGLAMTSLGVRSSVVSQHDYEATQALHLVRSESTRGQAIVSRTGFYGGGAYLIPRTVTIESSNMKKTIKLKTKVTQDQVLTEQGGFRTGGYTVRSLATAARGRGISVLGNRNDSIVRRYGEFTLRKRTFSEFHYFTNTDKSNNGTGDGNNVYFWGPDEIRGRVHSNSDIWIKQAGGGNNQGWPLFHNLVTTAGIIQCPTAINYEQVFQGGYIEEYNTYEYPPTANTIRINGTPLGTEGEEKIIFATVDRQGFSGMIGTIVEDRDSASVYNRYPPLPNQALGAVLFRNNFTGRDTLWSGLPAGTNRRSVFAHNKLWISGNFGGMQTWGCADTLYLKGDILLESTPMGNPPDAENSMNRTDIVGIVSEKSILIQYGHRDPIDSLRKHPNCGPDSDGIFIYAALCALGEAETIYEEGVFSFEYQHPHPSTPAYRIGTSNWSRIDIHRRRFPQIRPAQPWPNLPATSVHTPRPGLDYPFYNPLWPERQPYLERGTINLWGSVAQRRRGFVHRSVYDSEWPSGGVWNIPIDFCGPTSAQNWSEPIYEGGPGVQFNTMNFPGATGSGVGYKKNYNFDKRFLYTSPVDFPEVNLKGGSTPLQGESWILRRPPNTL